MTIALATRSLSVLFAVILACCCVAEEADPKPKWIWSPLQELGEVPTGAACYFRQTVQLDDVTEATLAIAAEDTFEVYFNGERVGKGSGWQHLTRFDVTEHIVRGDNVVAVKVVNHKAGTAALAAMLQLTFADGSKRRMISDDSWKTSIGPRKMWHLPRYADTDWRPARDLGALGSTPPWIETPLPSARRVAATHSPTKPKRAQLAELPQVPIALASAEEPATESVESRAKPRLLRPLQDSLPWLQKRGAKAVEIQPHVVKPPATKHLVPSASSSLETTSPGEIVNQHVRNTPKSSKPRSTATSTGPALTTSRSAGVTTPAAAADGVKRRTNEGKEAIAPIVLSTSHPANPTDVASGYKVPEGFVVEAILDGKQTGSLIAMTFNEFGQVLASRENGPLLLLEDTDGDETLDSVRTCCDKVKNCHGILALSGMVFVVGEGPEGVALYRLEDSDRDGDLDQATTLVAFDVTMGEHGPHGVVLGPDGNLYVAVGNHARAKRELDPLSPRRNLYEGDLIPRFEDPSGHALGVKAPGGHILRTDIQGKKVELFASGLRNAYDLAFNDDGQLFTYDSDMESDRGTTWYRPTQLYQVLPGSEFGWRSGWGKWPSYYQDAVPPIAQTGRGSPTGMVVYQHDTYPADYRHAAFLGDWSEGRILAVKLIADDSGYHTATETFASGKPLNVTDLDVGPDGSLYFVTGGRGTQGGLFRVRWKGPKPSKQVQAGAAEAASVLQLHSAWGRQQVATIQHNMGTAWPEAIRSISQDTARPSAQRRQALQIMQWVGPLPEAELLIELSRDNDPLLRRMVAALMADPSDDRLPVRLLEMLEDETASVRRQAAESLVRANRAVPYEFVQPLLEAHDGAEVWAGRRLLALDQPSEWQAEAFASDRVRVFIPAATTLMTDWGTPERAREVVDRGIHFLHGYLSDDDFIQLMRVFELALLQDNLTASDVPELASLLAEEFPSANHIMNRELIRLLVRLEVTTIVDRYLDHLHSDLPGEDHIHMAIHLAFLKANWTTEQKLQIAAALHGGAEDGNSVPSYLQNVATQFGKQFSQDDDELAIENGAIAPAAALAAVMRLPNELTIARIEQLASLDRSLGINQSDEVTKRLQVAILAVLARDGRDDAMAYLREVYDRDSLRRAEVAIGLAEKPSGDNWPYLVRSLSHLDGELAKEVIVRLQDVDRSPDTPEPYRQLIITGLRLADAGGDEAVKLLEHWRGFAGSEDTPPWNQALLAWQNWFSRTYPAEPTPDYESGLASSKWNYDELLRLLSPENLQNASAARGRDVFISAQCVSCHRQGSLGEAMGPDLSTLGSRFRTKEILESIVYPSRVIADQYRAKTIVTNNGKTYTGIVGSGGEDALVVLDASGRKHQIATEEVEETIPSKLSAMPEGLLNDITLEQIKDLMAFLMQPSSAEVTRRPTP